MIVSAGNPLSRWTARRSPASACALGVVLVLLAFAAYAPAIHGGFVWDDDFFPGNPALSEPNVLGHIWTFQPAKSWHYREFPLVYTTFWVERRLWGLETIGYHVVNIALHAINAILVWLMLTRLDAPGAWFAAAVFALHPVHVESVA